MSDANLDILRKMPPERAAAYARGLMSLFAWRPTLRQMYSSADLAYVATLAGRDKERYAKDQGDGGDLARLYASLLNDKLDAGLAVTTGDLDAIDAELASGRWRIDYSQQAWAARRAGDAVGPLKYAKGEERPLTKSSGSITGLMKDLMAIEVANRKKKHA